MNAVGLSHRSLASKTKVYYGDVYDLPQKLGLFDVVIVGAVLKHLSDPIRALASIARLTKSTIIVSTKMLDTEHNIARFSRDASRPDIDYVFWVYSLGVYRHVFAMLGFNIVRTVTDKVLLQQFE